MNILKTIFVAMLVAFGSSFLSSAQVQITIDGNIVASGSINTFNINSFSSEECITIGFENTSSITKNYSVTREKIVNPSGWTITKSTWELPGSSSTFCYPGSASLSWTTFNSIPTQDGESVFLEDCLEVTNDSCALYRYYISSIENGIEDSVDLMFCGILALNEKTISNVSVYPNPTFGDLKVDLGTIYNEVTVNVFNTLGQDVISKSFGSTSEININIASEPGVYILEIRAEDGKTARINIIKE